MGSRIGAECVGSRTGAECVGSRTGAESGAESVGSGIGAECVGSRGGADSVGSRGGADSGADCMGSRNGAGSGADSVGSRNGAGSGVVSVTATMASRTTGLEFTGDMPAARTDLIGGSSSLHTSLRIPGCTAASTTATRGTAAPSAATEGAVASSPTTWAGERAKCSLHPPILYRDADVGFAEPEPMQMGRSRLSLEEKRRRRNEGLCLYCGAAGHIAALCSVNARETAVKGLLRGGITLAKSSLAATLLTVKLQWSSVTYDCQALIDSGAEGNFLDSDLAYRLRLPVIALSQPIAVHALNGLSLSSITHSTGPLRLVTSGNHVETIQFLLTDTPVTPVVLGHPWLVLHNPHFNWSQSSILSWSEGCHATCLLSACPSVSCSVFQDEHMDLSNVPSVQEDSFRFSCFQIKTCFSCPH